MPKFQQRASDEMHYFEEERSRAEILGQYIIEHGATVRETAGRFGISKSTVHKDVTVELRPINGPLFAAVQTILQKNKEERHLRGGEATKRKYQKQRAQKSN